MANYTDNTSSAVVPFLFEGEGLVRVVGHDGTSWFVATDVARILGFRDAKNAVRYLDEDELSTLNQSTNKGIREHLIVSESGLYGLIFRSRKPAARRFRKWVTSEVLPAIRKTGVYRSPRQGLTPEERAERAALAAEQHRFNNDLRLRAAALQERADARQERQQWTRELHEVRMSGVSRAEVAKAAREFCRRIGIDIDATLAQGELPLIDKVH